MSRFIGVDLHKKMFTVCFYDDTTIIHKTGNYKIKKMDLFRRELRKEDIVAVEMTGNTRFFVEQIRAYVKEVKVINTSQFAVISHSVKKTDKRDAKVIAEFLSKGMLPEVRMKDEVSAQIGSLANTRNKLVELRTTLKNKIHSLLNAHGIELNREVLQSKRMLRSVLQYEVKPTVKFELKVIVEQIESQNEGIKKLEKELEKRSKDMDGFECITSIKGIGKLSGAILLSVIGDINNFESEKKLYAYFGVVPRVCQSNESVKLGHITKHGSKLGRATLIQCTLVAIRYSGFLRRFYEKLKAKKGSGKAIIATSRKLLGVIYNTLKNNWIFEDFPNYVIKKG